MISSVEWVICEIRPNLLSLQNSSWLLCMYSHRTNSSSSLKSTDFQLRLKPSKSFGGNWHSLLQYLARKYTKNTPNVSIFLVSDCLFVSVCARGSLKFLAHEVCGRGFAFKCEQIIIPVPLLICRCILYSARCCIWNNYLSSSPVIHNFLNNIMSIFRTMLCR